MLRISSCGVTSLIGLGLANLSPFGPEGQVGPVGVKSCIKNYVILPKVPYTNFYGVPIPVEVDPDPPDTLLQTPPPVPEQTVAREPPRPVMPPLTARGIDARPPRAPTSRPVLPEEIPIGAGDDTQPSQGIAYYTLGPLNLSSTTFEGDYLEIQLPFSVQYNGVLYSKIYVYPRSYVTFGSVYVLTDPFNYNAGINGFNPPVPGIFIGAGSGIYDPYAVYYGLEYENGVTTFRIRYEATESDEAMPLIWEMVFYANDLSRIDISAEAINIQGFTGLSSGQGLLTAFLLTTNSGVTCRPQATTYDDINITSTSSTQVGDDLSVEIKSIEPFKNYIGANPYGQTDVLETDKNLVLQSPFDMTISTSFNIVMDTIGGNISFTPTFENTDGAGGYTEFNRITILSNDNSNIQFTVDGFCKLVI